MPERLRQQASRFHRKSHGRLLAQACKSAGSSLVGSARSLAVKLEGESFSSLACECGSGAAGALASNRDANRGRIAGVGTTARRASRDKKSGAPVFTPSPSRYTARVGREASTECRALPIRKRSRAHERRPAFAEPRHPAQPTRKCRDRDPIPKDVRRPGSSVSTTARRAGRLQTSLQRDRLRLSPAAHESEHAQSPCHASDTHNVNNWLTAEASSAHWLSETRSPVGYGPEGRVPWAARPFVDVRF